MTLFTRKPSLKVSAIIPHSVTRARYILVVNILQGGGGSKGPKIMCKYSINYIYVQEVLNPFYMVTYYFK